MKKLLRSFLFFLTVFMACFAGAVVIYDKSMDIINDSYANSVYAYNNFSRKIINIDIGYPFSGDVVSSPLNFYGSARGNWFFDGTFPVKVLDKSEKVIGFSVAEAETDWMTEDMVSFKGSVTFSTNSDSGFIVFEKENPSGVGETEEFKLPVKFK